MSGALLALPINVWSHVLMHSLKILINLGICLGLCQAAFALEKSIESNVQNNIDFVNSTKILRVSSTLSAFNTAIDPRLNLIKTCGDLGFFANWSTQTCVRY
jgi:hypothetical protein